MPHLSVADIRVSPLFEENVIPCGTKFLREFNFADCDFLCFAGTNFCDLKRLVFLAGN